MTHLRNDTGGQGKAHSTGVVLGLLGRSQHLVQSAHLGGLGAGALVHKEDAGHTPAGDRIGVGVDVVRAHNGSSLDILQVAHLGGHVKIHDITGIVAIEVQDAAAVIDLFADLKNLLGAR